MQNPKISAKAEALQAKRHQAASVAIAEALSAIMRPASPAPSANDIENVAPVVNVAKPTAADREAKRESERADFSAARRAAALAVAEFYAGRSLPFKAASAKLTPLNAASRICAASPRSAALLLALATYGADNFAADGSFKRGGFIVPATLVNPSAPAGATFRAKPEAGCIGDQRDRTISFDVNAGDNAEATLRLHVAPAMRDIAAAFGDAKAEAFRALLAGYGVQAAIALAPVAAAA